jgi:hypothetical protein
VSSHAAAADLPAAAPSPRTRKFRQAAFMYLHVGLLYEFAVLEIGRAGLLPAGRGPLWLWLALGAAIVAVIFWALWFKQSVWVARLVWAAHLLRLPALIRGAFFPRPSTDIASSFYVFALVVVLVNLWLLARAAWDL